MLCNNCNSETLSVKFICLKDKLIQNCPNCPEKQSLTPIFNRDMIHVRGAYGEKSLRTAAHDADISRRKRAPDGHIYRDYNKKTFVMQ